ncbi:MAG: YdcF family protein [Clostridia bacterium]|nr:YdcF family protein [Clostridia bacterium]
MNIINKVKIIRFLLLFFGSVFFIHGLLVTLNTNFNAGNILVLGLGLILLLYSIFYLKIKKLIPFPLRAAFWIMLILVISFILFLLIFGSFDNVDYDEDVLIVLGAGLRGDRPSVALRARLDAALRYHEKNPDAYIAVTGGQGHGETVTEASAMAKYLIEHGVPEELIILEDKSTSTYENFNFTKKILDGMLEGDYTAAFITSEYHIFRGGIFARRAGLEGIRHFHADTRWDLLLTGTFRECLGVIKLLILGN